MSQRFNNEEVAVILVSNNKYLRTYEYSSSFSTHINLTIKINRLRVYAQNSAHVCVCVCVFLL